MSGLIAPGFHRILRIFDSSCLFAGILGFLALPALPQTATQNACEFGLKIEVPEGDRPTLEDIRAAGVRWGIQDNPGPGMFVRPSAADRYCDASRFYYFSQTPERFQHARVCVLAKLGLFRRDVDSMQAKAAQSAVSGGATDPGIGDPDGLILAMLYGNGEGVRRNLLLAEQFLCEYGGGIGGDSPEELLLQFHQIVESGKHYDVCENEAGDFGRSTTFFCLGIQIEKVSGEIRRQQTAITASNPPPVKAAFTSLEAAQHNFLKAYTTVESDACGGGTGCGVGGEADELLMQRSWSDALKAVRAGKAPAAGSSASAFADLDRELKKDDQQMMQGLEPLESVGSARTVARAWVNYRESWVRFGVLRWPGIPRDQWRSWITGVYLKILKSS